MLKLVTASKTGHQPDRDMCARLLAGDEASYNAFFEEYFPRVMRFCAARIPVDDVEDVAMNVMNRVFRRLETYRGEASLYTWICQVARSEVADHFRRQSRRPATVSMHENSSVQAATEAIPDETGPEPESALEQSQASDMLAQALTELPENYGTLLEAKYIEGLAVKEIAERQQMTAKSVESALSRARKALKDKLQTLQRAALPPPDALLGEQS